MAKKLMIALLVGALCLMGLTSVFAQKIYPTLAEYEKLTGKSIEKFNEAPMLKTRVAAGELPPVEQRLPEEPMVVEPLEEIGRYGGTLKGAALQPTTGGHDLETTRKQDLFKLHPDLKTVYPNIVKGWDLSENLTTLTVYLRKGMKWSDGAPFTADDFLFWYEDIILNDELTPVKPRIWSPGGDLAKIERINDYTIRFQFTCPNPIIIEALATGNNPFAPKHHLKKYHIKYNARANELAKKEGYDEWWMCFNFHNMAGQKQQDVDLPTFNSWILNRTDSYGNRYFERNPYYWKIDTAGNQLPYIDGQDRILVENREVATLKLIAGEFTHAAQHTELKNYTLYKEGEKKGNYHVMLWKVPWGSDCTFAFNLTHKDPVLRKIFRDIRFRQAMSLAINRQEINDVFFFGKAVPRQATIDPGCRFYEDWMGKYYAEYDPDRANRFLDEMGLNWDKNHQYRLRPDGKTLAITLVVRIGGSTKLGPCELTKDYWGNVGVKVAVKGVPWEYYRKRERANELDVGIWQMGGCNEFASRTIQAKRFRPSAGDGLNYAIPWWNWLATGGKTGEEPLQEIKKLNEVVSQWLSVASGTREYMELGREMLTINLKNLLVIGTVGLSPRPIIVKNNLCNAPKEGLFDGSGYSLWLPYCADQWFFTNIQSSD